MTLFRSLQHRQFALVWTGQTISRLGDSLYRIALAWWVLEKTGSAAAMGTVLVFTTVPMLVFLLVGGVAVDRLPRGRVMLVSDLLRGIVVAVMAYLSFVGNLEILHVFIASAAFGLVDAFFQPAYSAIVPEIAPSELLPSANSLTSLSGRLTGILGPALGAAIVEIGGTSSAFALDAVSFIASAVCLVPIAGMGLVRSVDRSKNALYDLRDGLSTVLSSPWLWVTIGIFAIANITLDGPVSVALPFLVKDVLHGDVNALGFAYSASSLGSIVAAIWLGRYTRIRRRGLVVYVAAIICALAVMVCGLALPLQGVAIALFVNGLCISVFGLIWVNTLQELVPREKLGRITSIDMLGSYMFLPIGYAVTGWATDWLGASLVFGLGGSISVALVALGLLHPQVRHLD